MTEQQTHLKSVIEQQSGLITEIQELNNQLSVKREMATKLQGIVEYLTGVGVVLPDEDDTPPNPPKQSSTPEIVGE